MTSDTSNYVGLLQEKCMKAKANLPKYIVDILPDNNFICVCRIGHLSTDGTGINKKIAKQIAARAMFEKLETDSDFEIKSPQREQSSIVSKLNEYSSQVKKDKPLYAELPVENGEFVSSCTFDGFIGKGKGATRKMAKEKSADDVAKHFDLFKCFEHANKLNERKESLKNSITKLHEYCQAKKLYVGFGEQAIDHGSKTPVFVVKCTVGELEVNSAEKSSKKEAKLDAATKMLQLLTETPTPASSPESLQSENHDMRLDLDDDHDMRLDLDDDKPLKRFKADL